MTEDPRPPRRPVVGSRNPTGRPRKVAGQQRPPADGGPAIEPPAEESAEYSVRESVQESVEADGPTAPANIDEPVPREDTVGAPRLLAGTRTTLALTVALVLLIGALAAEGWYLWGRGEPVVSAERPVVTGEIAHRAAVESARQSVTEILSYGYQDFDAEIEDATTRMTDAFAQQFRDTADDVKDRFVKNRTEQEVKVIAASVVQASSEQVRALLFLDQYVARPGKGTAVTPYRALVTVVHTDAGWLVSNIETR